MQDYIRAHLNDRITLADLARSAFFSPWYAARIFRELTGLAPADYIRRLKLSASAIRLRDEKTRVTDVAFDLGFGSVDGYQRAFFREFGCNPREYAAHPRPLYLFTPYGVKYGRMERNAIMENVRSVFLQVIDKPARKVFVRRGVRATEYFGYCEEVGCDIWGLLASMTNAGGEPVCLWLPEAFRTPGTSVYVLGVEREENDPSAPPEGFDVISLPAAKYLMFQGEPFEEIDYQAAIGAVHTAIDRYNPQVIGYQWDDSNPRIQLEPIGSRGYIELRAVKPL